MTDVTYRLRAAGPGFRSDIIRAKYLLRAKGNIELAYWMACEDVAELTKGGMYRPPPSESAPALKLDTAPPLDVTEPVSVQPETMR